jgi:tight adherence protein C
VDEPTGREVAVTSTEAVVAVTMAVGVGAVLVPDGSWARVRLRRGRGERRGVLVRRAEGGAALGRRGFVVPAALARAPELVGRALRTASRRRSDPEADRHVGATVLVAVAVAVIVGPVVAVPCAATVFAVPLVRARSRGRTEERRVRGALPDVVDLFRLAVGSGLSLHQALDVVAVRAPAPVDGALEEVRRKVGLGVRLGDALDALDQLGDAALPLAAALRGSARYGAPLGAALERVAVDARVLRRRRAEEDARRLPVQLLFPLVLCVLPAFGLLAVVPLVLASLRSLQL